MQKTVKGRSKSSKSIVITGDMHVGNNYAIHTGEFAKIPEKLLPIKDLWYSASDKLKRDKPSLFFINGEHIDGDNEKELGAQQWTTNINRQMADAENLLKAFKITDIGFNRGSNYHTTKGNTSFEETTANALKNVYNVVTYSPFDDNIIKTTTRKEWNNEGGHHPKIVIDDLFVCRINGLVFHIMHHVGGSKWFSYLPTALGREMAQLVFFNEKLWETKDSPSIIVRSHTHRYVQIKYSTTAGFVCPSWKIFDRFILKNGQDAGSVGLMEVVVEPNGEFLINDIMLENKDYPKINIVDIN
jgi:hypothetical protein